MLAMPDIRSGDTRAGRERCCPVCPSARTVCPQRGIAQTKGAPLYASTEGRDYLPGLRCTVAALACASGRITISSMLT